MSRRHLTPDLLSSRQGRPPPGIVFHRMGRIHRIYLPGSKLYACSNCHCHLTSHDDIVSKSFQGRTGRAYLFNTVVNVSLGPTEDRILNTGLHKVLSGALPHAGHSVVSDLHALHSLFHWVGSKTGQLCRAHAYRAVVSRRDFVLMATCFFSLTPLFVMCLQVSDIYCNCCDIYCKWLSSSLHAF
jgi:hypothetical protein